MSETINLLGDIRSLEKTPEILHKKLNISAAVHKEKQGREALEEEIDKANQQIAEAIHRPAIIRASEWFGPSVINSMLRHRFYEQNSQSQHSGILQAICAFNESLLDNLPVASDYHPDPARLCIGLRIPSQKQTLLIPTGAVIGEIETENIDNPISFRGSVYLPLSGD